VATHHAPTPGSEPTRRLELGLHTALHQSLQPIGLGLRERSRLHRGIELCCVRGKRGVQDVAQVDMLLLGQIGDGLARGTRVP
jgi:hypothetical protein